MFIANTTKSIIFFDDFCQFNGLFWPGSTQTTRRSENSTQLAAMDFSNIAYIVERKTQRMPLIRSAELRELIAAAAPALSNISAQDQTLKNTPEQWSNQEILGHLIDSTYNNHRRFVQAGLQEDLIFDGYSQDHWVESQHYNNQEWETLVATWVSVNNHLAHLISSLPEQLMRRPTTKHNFHEIGFRNISKGEPASLDFLVEDYIIHIRHHLKQLLPNLG